MQRIREILRIIGLPVVIASLCCLSPVIVVAFGLGSVAFASSLADTLYHGYKWYFRLSGLLLILVAVGLHWRSRGVCTLSQAARRRKEIINTVLIAFLGGIVGYIVFLYVIVHYIGVFFGIWS